MVQVLVALLDAVPQQPVVGHDIVILRRLDDLLLDEPNRVLLVAHIHVFLGEDGERAATIPPVLCIVAFELQQPDRLHLCHVVNASAAVGRQGWSIFEILYLPLAPKAAELWLLVNGLSLEG